MKASTLVWLVIIILILGGGGWYYMSMQSPAMAPADNAAGTVLEGSGQMVDAADQPLPGGTQKPLADGAEGSVIGGNLALGTDSNEEMGTYLIAYNGMTLYTTSKDTGSTSNCYDQCAVNWPPYLVGPEDNVHNVKAGVGGKVDTTIRTDGGIQVTYEGRPLYFYIQDKASGDVKGEGVGGVWKIVKP